MSQFALSMPFEADFLCSAVSKMPHQDRPELEKGGKIILPASALEQLTQRNIQYPMLFKLSNRKESRHTHCGVLDFVAEEGRVYLPYWMMNNLLLEEGSMVHIENISLSVATFAKFQPQSTDFLDITNPKAVLENSLLAFSCLTMGDMIPLNHNDKIYELRVIEMLPDNAVAIMQDTEIELAAPISHVDPSGEGTSLAGQHNADTEDDDDEEEVDEEEEYENYEDYVEDDLEEVYDCLVMHEKLKDDFELLQKHCKEAQLVNEPVLDETVVTFSLPLNILEEDVQLAWGLVPQVKIIIRVVCSYSRYFDDSSTARVEICQDGHNTSGVLVQLQDILNKYVKQMIKDQNDASLQQSVSGAKEPKAPRLSSPPSAGQGLLVQVLAHAQQRLKTLNAHCVICDKPHPPAKVSLLKLMPCDTHICQFTYKKYVEKSGVPDEKMTNDEDILFEGPKVLDLLIAMAKAAAASNRWELAFNPYPSVVDPNSTRTFVFSDTNKKTTIVQLRQVLAKVIGMDEMTQKTAVELKMQMDTTDPLIYPLLQWLIVSNKSLLVGLQPQQRLNFMDTKHQFLLRTSSPDREAAFSKAKETHGSIFAFHGSSIENWHSILRRGLVNASGTKLQMNGACYGHGIYLSPDASVSFSYASSNSMRPMPSSPVHPTASTEGESLHLVPPEKVVCVALCEVIDDSEHLKKVANDIWVVSKEDYVVTRFFFVYVDHLMKGSSVRSDNKSIMEQIRKAL